MRIRLNLIALKSYSSTTAFAFFVNLDHLTRFDNAFSNNLSKIDIRYNGSTPSVTGYDENSTQLWIRTGNDVVEISDEADYVEFDGDLLSENYLVDLMKAGVTTLPNEVALFTYIQKSENDALSKTLQYVNIIVGKFNHAIGLKNINVDLTGYSRNFNYVYIPTLNRYYYVDSIELISADVTRLHLKEDVLMSWSSLIKSQKGFITRYEYAPSTKIVDDRRPIEDVVTIEYIFPESVASPITNTEFDASLDNSKYKILVSTISEDIGNKESVNSIAINLPALSPIQSRNERIAFISYEQLEYLIGACLDNDNILTFINGVVLLPFDPETPYTDAVDQDGWIAGVVIADDKYLCDDYKFHASVPSDVNIISCKRTLAGATPYFVVAHFKWNGVFNNYLDYDPYTSWEIYIPFVGWIKVSASQVLGKTMIVYYTLDAKTGMGTAYLFDDTDHKLIWSSNCQLGIKLDLTTTNATEIARQKEANELNMILGLMASALSVGVGVATKNPVAVAGGILSAGKTIASNVNNNNMLFERAQTSFGTSEGVFHSPFNIQIRRSYHKKISIHEATYKHLQGLPYHMYSSSFSTLAGYVEIGEIHFDPKDNVIYQDEITEIVDLLQKGVIF